MPEPFGLRLNADGSVDAVSCYDLGPSFRVAYVLQDELDDDEWPDDWVLFVGPEADHSGPTVVRYGDEPLGTTSSVLEDPPRGWVVVSTTVGTADRDELVTDEWIWFHTSAYPWEPEHPCGGLTADDLAG